MTKAEILAYLDSTLEQLVQRGRVSTGVTKTRLRVDHRVLTQIREAIVKHVPADAVPPVQKPLFRG